MSNRFLDEYQPTEVPQESEKQISLGDFYVPLQITDTPGMLEYFDSIFRFSFLDFFSKRNFFAIRDTP